MNRGLKPITPSIEENLEWILNDPNGYIDHVLTEAHQIALERKIKLRKTKE